MAWDRAPQWRPSGEALTGQLDLLLLAALRDGPAHGYAIIARLRSRSGGTFDLPEGTIYPALHRLERRGLIASRWSEANGRRRRVYRLAPRGRRARDLRPGARHVSAPQTINAYLAAFNEELEVGLRSRRRIFWEVTVHLGQAMEEQMRRGASAREGEARATAAFGAPEEVAARFQAGLIGRLDRRLALSIRWLHRFATERPMGLVFALVGLAMLLAAALAVVAASFGRDALAAAGGFVAMGTVVALFYGWSSRRRALREMLRASPLLTMLLAYPAVTGCVVVLSGAHAAASGQAILAALLTYTSWFAIQWASQAAVDRAARRCSGAIAAERRLDWRVEHPWRAGVADGAPLPLALLALIVAYPAPGDLRVALAGLVAAIGALAVALVRLERGRREKDAYRAFYDERATTAR